MKIELEWATNPEWLNEEHTMINLLAKFSHVDEAVPFTASVSDVEPHGRLIFELAAAGEYGEVAPYIAPTPLEIAQRDNPRKRREGMQKAITQSQHFDMMGDADKANEWRQYYRDVYALESSPEWPLVQWPVEPM